MVVFKILNKISGQLYVGTCRNDIDERWALYVQAAEAGLDFPLYQEIRQHGQASFELCELDFADNSTELKELELVHTIELSARSLRGYKFGRSDQVIKRRKTSEQFLDWMKDAEPADQAIEALEPLELDLSNDQPPAETELEAATQQPAPSTLETKPAPAGKPQVVAETAPCALQPPKQTPTANHSATTNRSATATDPAADSELEKTVFAEGMGLLAKALDHNQQLQQQQQQDQQQIQQLRQALNASQQGLEHQQQRLEQLEALVQQTLAAVQASQQASEALLQTRHQLDLCYDAPLKAPTEQRPLQTNAPSLQDQFEQLMKRLKPGTTSETSAEPQAPVPDSNSSPKADKAAVSKSTDDQELQAPEATSGSESLQPQTAQQDQPETTVPARAWIAPAKDQQQATEFSASSQQATKIVRRRTKAINKENEISLQATRPSGPRKRLSIRAASPA